ncbi:exodeoxyribonuclease VII small subunit [candidate division KSB1 bacterium]|nr:exodeoxyribonuclease VII small subunit [candidate division KSB1 bacterium]
MAAIPPNSESTSADTQSFEAALEQLQQLVRELEQGDVPLEQSLVAFELGQRLIKYCQDKLATAEQSLKQLAADADEALGNDKPKS